VACGTGLYGWKIEFEQAKPVVWVGVLLYVFHALSNDLGLILVKQLRATQCSTSLICIFRGTG
jgi:hypothetical protein